MFKCPYCSQDSYAKSSKKKGKFESWISTRNHTSKCIKNNHEYFIDQYHGPIHYTFILNKTSYQIRDIYPNLKDLVDIKRQFKKYNLPVSDTFKTDISKENIIKCIQNFYKENNRIPQSRDFYLNSKYPSYRTIERIFTSWNNAIEAAGFEPNYNDGYGKRTKAKDGVLYRSQAEVYFVDTFLYEKYIYEYERKYD